MNIIDSLTKDISQILQLELSKPRFNIDRLYVHLLLLIGHQRYAHIKKPNAVEDNSEAHDDNDTEENQADNLIKLKPFKELKQKVTAFRFRNPYIRGLLFRDLHHDGWSEYQEQHCLQFGNIYIHEEAVRYVSEVLCKTIQPKDANPTSMHLLLKKLCRLSLANSAWQTTDINRQKTAIIKDADWFQIVSQNKHLNANNKPSKKREEFGAYYLTAGECCVEIAEELNLPNVLNITPKPLPENFASDAEFIKQLKAVLDSLNKKYYWLRRAGLPPVDWLNHDKLSVENIEKLAYLVEAVKKTEEWLKDETESAFKKVFEERNEKILGFTHFEDFKNSTIGDFVIHRNNKRFISKDELLDTGFDIESEENSIDDLQMKDGLNDLLSQAEPLLINNPVERLFFVEVLLGDRVLFGKNGLCEQAEFKTALKNSENYAELAQQLNLATDEQQLTALHSELAEKLFFALRVVLFKVLIKHHNIEPILSDYIETVIIEEKPFLGSKGLINKKSFQKHLAQKPDLNRLSNEELALRLDNLAKDELAKLSQDLN